jgi:hypothetical protein
MPKQDQHRRQWHKDWRTWLIVALMLAGIGIYVLTLDDSLMPLGGSRNTPSAPAVPTSR